MAQDQNQIVDLDQLLSMNTAEITHRVTVIHDAEGNSKSGFIIVGKNSDQYLAVTGKARVSNVMKSAARKKPLDTSTDEGARILVSTIENNEMETALGVMVGWFGWGSEGAPASFDRNVAEKMLTKFPTWKVKVLADLDNDGNFIKA